MSAITFNLKLKELGIQHLVGSTWVLNQKYQDKGYTGTRTFTYTGTDGISKTSITMYWTEKGRAFLHELLNPKLQKQG
jgi:anti-repressor protein